MTGSDNSLTDALAMNALLNPFGEEHRDLLLFNQGVQLIQIVKGTKSPIRGLALRDFFNGSVSCTFEELTKWRKEGHDRAAVCGRNNLIVLDFDSVGSFARFWDSKTALRVPNETFTVRSSRGFSVWFKDSGADFVHLRSSIDGRPQLEAEMLVHHHLVACPLNTHPSGAIYTLVGTGKILEKPGIVRAAIDRFRSLGWRGSPYSYDRGSGDESHLGRDLSQQLSEDEKTAVAKEIAPCWRPGYRNKLIMSLTGILIKRGVVESDALDIFERIIKMTEDKEARFSALNKVKYQYRNRAKLPRLLGYKGLVEVLESVKC